MVSSCLHPQLWQQLLKGWNFQALQGSDSGSAPEVLQLWQTGAALLSSRCAPAHPYLLLHVRVRCHNEHGLLLQVWNLSGHFWQHCTAWWRCTLRPEKTDFLRAQKRDFSKTHLYLFSFWLFSAPISSQQIPFPQLFPYTTVYFTNTCKSTKKTPTSKKSFLIWMAELPSPGSTHSYIVCVPMKCQAGK